MSIDPHIRTCRPFKTRQILLLSGAHCFHDIFSGFLVPLLPLLVKKLSLSLALAGALTVIQRIPSLLNPLVGKLVDQTSPRIFVVWAPVATAVAMSLIGLAPNFWVLAALLLCSGISVSFLHVPAPVMISAQSGPLVGRGMSFFMVGGELARTIAPIFAMAAVSLWTLPGLYHLLPLAGVAALILNLSVERTSAKKTHQKTGSLLGNWLLLQHLFIPVLGILTARAFMTAAIVTYLPIYIAQEQASLWFASISLSVIEAAGTVGTMAAGPLSDRIGRKAILTVALMLSPFLMFLFLSLSGWWLIPVLVLIGLIHFSASPVLMALVQENAVDHPATANGIYMTMNFITSPLIALLVGVLADHFGMRPVFFWCGALAAAGIPCALKLGNSPKTAGVTTP